MTFNNYYSQLHILRGFSALMVVIGHAKVVFWSGGKLFLDKFPISTWDFFDYILFTSDLFSSAAQSFVIVFFVLSGFFINHSFKKHNWNFKNFIINRFVRIFPPYFASLIFSLLVFLLLNLFEKSLFETDFSRALNQRLTNAFNNLNFKSFFYALFFIPVKDYFACNFSFWSLIYEWIFYLFIAFFKYVNKYLLMISFALLITGMFLNINEFDIIMNFLFNYSFSFFVGFVFYDIVQKQNVHIYFKNKTLNWTLVLFFLLLMILFELSSVDILKKITPIIFSLFTIRALLIFEIKSVNILRIGNFLGKISFTLYLFHLPILFLFYGIIFQFTGKYFFYDRIYWLFVLLTIPISYLFYYLVEERCLIWIKKLSK